LDQDDDKDGRGDDENVTDSYCQVLSLSLCESINSIDLQSLGEDGAQGEGEAKADEPFAELADSVIR
jgi:hypothetical protein